MSNFNLKWKHKLLEVSDLPDKTQRFIGTVNLDVSNLTLAYVVADPNGDYLKCFNGRGNSFNNRLPKAQFERYNNKIYFINHIPIGVTIHELTHYYLDNSNHDTKTIGESFINQYGRDALTGYAIGHLDDATDERYVQYNRNRGVIINDIYFKEKWDAVVCEIVSTYGRRGQFEKIKELFGKN